MTDDIRRKTQLSSSDENASTLASETNTALERFRLAEAAGGVGTWEWNIQDDASVNSEETLRLYGLEPGENLGYEGWLERIHPDDRSHVDRILQEALSGGGRYDAEFRVRLPQGGERRVWARGLVAFDASGDPVRVLGVNIDLTPRKRVEHERDDVETESRRANELKDDFLAMLGHELRNPIGAITNGIEILRNETAQEHRTWAEEMIERQTLQLKRLVDDILEVSRVAKGQLEIRPEVVSLSVCVEAARDAVRERLKGNPRDFDVRLPEERIHLFVDPARMQQILANLLLNAIRYTDEGERIELAAERRGERVVIRVEDEGTGLTQENLGVIFEPFVRVSKSLRRAGSGLGIGLTLVKKLVELHGGTVSAESEGPGKGCTFTVDLPIHDGEEVPEDDAPIKSLQPLRILVIDDNKDLAQGLKKRLSRQGHEVALTHDGPQGIAAARQMKPDVVLVDVGLPSMDGYEVAEKLRTEASLGMRIAAISGFKERGEEKFAEEVFDHYFLKPVNAEQLNTWLIRVASENEGGNS